MSDRFLLAFYAQQSLWLTPPISRASTLLSFLGNQDPPPDATQTDGSMVSLVQHLGD